MFKHILTVIVLSAIMLQAQSMERNIFKDDYIQACTLIAEKYIYLERKLNKTRLEFLNEHLNYAETINWNKETFVKELRALRNIFDDGHFSWSIPRENSPVKGYYTLGFAAEVDLKGELLARRIYSYYNGVVQPGDRITEMDGVSASEYLKRIGMFDRQSTEGATIQSASRNITLIKVLSPLQDNPGTVKIKLMRDGKEIEANLEWKRCGLTGSYDEAMQDNHLLLVQGNGYLSLEEIPEQFTALHKSLIFYPIIVSSRRICVLHVRDFLRWNWEDINATMARIIELKPEIVVVDLKDSAGGGFNDVLALSQALGVNEPFRFFFDEIDEKGLRKSGVADFKRITEEFRISNIWNGKLIIRTNEICGSACDFFARWMKINKRGIIAGTPPAGRGGGTDDFELKNTKATLSIPMRERIPFGWNSSVEGNTMEIDYKSDRTIKEIVRELIEAGKI